MSSFNGHSAAATGQRSVMHASAGNRTQVTSMATMYSATRPLMQPVHVMCIVSMQTPCLCSLALWRPAVFVSGGSSCVLISAGKTQCGQRMAALTCDHRTRHQTPATLHERRLEHRRRPRCQSAVRCHVCSQRWYWPARWRCPTRMHGSGWCAHSAQRHDHCTQSLSCSILLSDVAWLPQGPHAAAAGALWSLH